MSVEDNLKTSALRILEEMRVAIINDGFSSRTHLMELLSDLCSLFSKYNKKVASDE